VGGRCIGTFSCPAGWTLAGHCRHGGHPMKVGPLASAESHGCILLGRVASRQLRAWLMSASRPDNSPWAFVLCGFVLAKKSAQHL